MAYHRACVQSPPPSQDTNSTHTTLLTRNLNAIMYNLATTTGHGTVARGLSAYNQIVTEVCAEEVTEAERTLNEVMADLNEVGGEYQVGGCVCLSRCLCMYVSVSVMMCMC